ncbi:MAG: hypothetical protein R3240_13385 [Gammaproteobacteria bacterium]|nr:hypothetical protein [Gammaproteobacteria bacterium]
MIHLNFYLFLAILEVMLILLIITVVQGIFIKKYRPYFMANTQPQLFLRKYIQRLIRITQHYAKSFNKAVQNEDEDAIEAQRQLTARLNWLILERDFASTVDPDARYWEDLSNRIKDMLAEWKEIKLIKEPPELRVVELALQDDIEEIDFENMNIDQAAKEQIKALKKRIFAMSGYQTMYQELELAYKTLDQSYNEIKKSISELELEAQEAEKLRKIVQNQEANEANLNAMLEEVEKSKERLNEELEQLEEAYVALEHEASPTTNILRHSENPDAQEILNILIQQENVLVELRKSLANISMKPGQKEKIDKHTDEVSRTNKEINHCMQMLELERERLADELKQYQEDGGFD